jgi:DNA repair protein RecO (recombination protein O)
MSERERVLLEHGFVLHQRAYRNTSQLLECLAEQHGRIGLVARGSRAPKSGQRALLQPFAPLRLSWQKRGELGRLTLVEAAGPSSELAGPHLLAGYYANELLLRRGTIRIPRSIPAIVAASRNWRAARGSRGRCEFSR